MPRGLDFNLIDHIELIDWTGRTIHAPIHVAIGRTPISLEAKYLSCMWIMRYPNRQLAAARAATGKAGIC
jgi:hypothetical protein